MSCVVREVAGRGEAFVRPAAYAAATLADAAKYEAPGGVYAAFGTWHDHRVVRLTNHFDRFEDSARRLEFELSLDRELVRRELCTIITEAGFAGARLRVSAHPRTYAAESVLTVAVEPYAGPPAELRRDGVVCRTAPHAARANPRVKQTSWLAERARLAEGAARTSTTVYEWLLLDEADRDRKSTRLNSSHYS